MKLTSRTVLGEEVEFTLAPGTKFQQGDNNLIDQDGFVVAIVPRVQIKETRPDGVHWASSPEFTKYISPKDQENLLHLFSAAPEMIEVLLEIKGWLLCDVDDPNGTYTVFDKTISPKIDAAIMKALWPTVCEIDGG